MKREIKFKAWDKEFKEMLSNIIIYQGEVYKNTTPLANNPLNAELIQYTELKDDNGQEIYESDVVKIVLKGKYINTYDGEYFLEEEQTYVGEVCFDNGYYIKTKEYCPSLTHLLKKSLEKIGNKFENPELLSN